MKKTGLIVIIAIIAVIVLLAGYVISVQNSLVPMNEKVEAQSSEIQNQLQRRADLIPNFVATVKGYTEYEQSTLTAVTEARAAVGRAESTEQQAEAGEQLDRAISVWVNAVTEAYPDLKASAQFVALEDELAGSENRLAQARRDYNEAAKDYNTAIRLFPKNIIAGMLGYEKADYFEASAGSEQVPSVQF